MSGGAKCTLEAVVTLGGGKSQKRTTGGRALGLGSAGGAVTALRWRIGLRRATRGAEAERVRLASRTLLVFGPGCLAALAVAAGLLLYCV